MEGQKQRHPSGGVSVSTEMVLGLEGVELGADGKVRNFFLFLSRSIMPMTKRLTGVGDSRWVRWLLSPQDCFHAGANHLIYAVLCHP